MSVSCVTNSENNESIEYITSVSSVRQQKTALRLLLVDLSKEDVQLNQVVSRCRLYPQEVFLICFHPSCGQGSEAESEGKGGQTQEEKV